MTITLLEPGTPAPGFSLPDESGVTRHMDDWAGRWLCVWWNPLALAKVCRSCGQKVVETLGPLQAQGVDVVGLTLDPVAVNAEKSMFVFDMALPILSSDWDTANAWKAARPATSPWAQVPHPASYLVNPDGVIERSWFVTDAGKRHVFQVLEAVAPVPLP